MSSATYSSTTVHTHAPAWAIALRKFNNRILTELGGGPRVIKFAWVINTQKAGTFLFLGFLMWWYAGQTAAATSPAAWIYLALHGSYGLVWLLKDLTFPDPGWQVKVTWGSVAAGLFGLGMYWSFGWLLISGVAQPSYPLPDWAWFCLCISLCMLGSVIMIAADCQKYYTLRVQRGLITDGMHRYIRHPNYLGEMLIYGAFALLVGHWLPWLWLAVIWLGLFAPNMAMKEASMSRYPEWADYKRRSWWLVPGIF
jgi:protein-S-isoprenylcysteine O-methyltransferase Ste14